MAPSPTDADRGVIDVDAEHVAAVCAEIDRARGERPRHLSVYEAGRVAGRAWLADENVDELEFRAAGYVPNDADRFAMTDRFACEEPAVIAEAMIRAVAAWRIMR